MQEFNKKQFGQRLRYVRENIAKLPVMEFCQEIDLTVQSYHNYLSGYYYPKAWVVFNICRKFDVSADWLLGLKEDDQ